MEKSAAPKKSGSFIKEVLFIRRRRHRHSHTHPFLVAQPFVVSGDSMDDTFENGQYLIINELSYEIGVPSRGDVMIFKYPLDPKEYFIKRVIGLPGEKVVIHDNTVTIYKTTTSTDGFVLSEPYTKGETLGEETVNSHPINISSWATTEWSVPIRACGVRYRQTILSARRSSTASAFGHNRRPGDTHSTITMNGSPSKEKENHFRHYRFGAFGNRPRNRSLLRLYADKHAVHNFGGYGGGKKISEGEIVVDSDSHEGGAWTKLEEKISLLRLYNEYNLFREPQPVMISTVRPFRNDRTKVNPKESHHSFDIIGTNKSIAEAVLIKTALALLKKDGVEDLHLEINSIGDKKSTARFGRELTAFYRRHLDDLPSTCKEKFKKHRFPFSAAITKNAWNFPRIVRRP